MHEHLELSCILVKSDTNKKVLHWLTYQRILVVLAGFPSL